MKSSVSVWGVDELNCRVNNIVKIIEDKNSFHKIIFAFDVEKINYSMWIVILYAILNHYLSNIKINSNN